MHLNSLFFVFAAMVCLPLIYLIFTKNIIRAAFAFTMSLLGMAALYVLLSADFMAVVQIMIYAGGIVILLIFGVMLTERTQKAGVYTEHHQLFSGIIVSSGLMFFLVSSIMKSGQIWVSGAKEIENQTRQIGVLYLTDHLIAFELIAFLLLVALVGAAYLSKKSDS